MIASTFPHPLTKFGEKKRVLFSLSMSMNTRFFAVLKGCFIHGKHTTRIRPAEFPKFPIIPFYFKLFSKYFLGSIRALKMTRRDTYSLLRIFAK